MHSKFHGQLLQDGDVRLRSLARYKVGGILRRDIFCLGRYFARCKVHWIYEGASFGLKSIMGPSKNPWAEMATDIATVAAYGLLPQSVEILECLCYVEFKIGKRARRMLVG